jgi:hypothetical protein
VVPNPCLPADDEIVGSAIQLVIISDLFALDAPIVLGQVLQFLEKRISLSDAREKFENQNKWSTKAWNPAPYEKYFLGNHTILLQSKKMTSK